jgi:hypothetical protein
MVLKTLAWAVEDPIKHPDLDPDPLLPVATRFGTTSTHTGTSDEVTEPQLHEITESDHFLLALEEEVHQAPSLPTEEVVMRLVKGLLQGRMIISNPSRSSQTLLV